MSSDVEDMLDSMAATLEGVLRAVERGETVTINRVEERGGVRVSTNVTVSGLPEYLEAAARRASLTPPRDPLIDVIDDEDTLTVLVALPGVKKEDVKVGSSARGLTVRVSRAGVVHERIIDSGVKPRRLKVRSVVENNAVVELVFDKKRRGHSH